MVEGWFLSHARVTAIKLIYPGAASFPVEDRNRPSEGVWDYHKATFGESARHARFRLIEPIADRELDLEVALIRVEMEGGHVFEAPLGPILRVPPPKSFTQEQHDLVMSFESVGDNCEFGLVQRLVGSERLSLLRYAGVADIERLAEHIARGLPSFGDSDDVVISRHVNEWMARALGPDLVFHTGRSVESIAAERIQAEESRKLAFMAQKFIDDCESAHKIFVYRVLRDDRGGPDGTRGMDAMYEALQIHGPVRLLWVNVADDQHPHASVEHVRGRLYRGYIDHLAPPWNAFDFKVGSWLELLAEARVVMAVPAESMNV